MLVILSMVIMFLLAVLLEKILKEKWLRKCCSCFSNVGNWKSLYSIILEIRIFGF